MNIKHSVIDYRIQEQLNWYGHVRIVHEERLPQKNLEYFRLDEEEGKTSKYVNAASNIWDETEVNQQH